MTLHSAAQPRPSPERVQREHELNQALEAARRLQARLELLGDRAADVAVVVSLRASLARDLVVNGLPCQTYDYKPNDYGPDVVARGLSDVEGDALTRQALLLEDETHV